MGVLEQILTASTLFVVLMKVAPLLLAALGGAFTQQGNILNIGLEGMMLIGAFTSVAVGSYFGSALVGVIAAIVAGTLLAMIYAFASLWLKADFIVVGIGVNLLAAGLSIFLLQVFYGNPGVTPPSANIRLPKIDVGPLANIPGIGGAINGQTALVWIAFLCVPLAALVLYRTKYGVHLRAVGEDEAAAEAAGIPRVSDYNGPEQDGASWAQVTQKGGKRFSAADAYLRPAAKRPNLEIVTGAQVLRVELDGKRATGVRYRDKRGRELVARASREVILSAGAYGSPQLLMLSGIGCADDLAGVGVAVGHELDGVGKNLHDHPFLVCIFESTAGGSLLDAEHPRYLAEYLLRKTGPLTSSVAEAFAFVRSRARRPTCSSTSPPRSSPSTGPRPTTSTPTPSARRSSARRAAAGSSSRRPTRRPTCASSPTRSPIPRISRRSSRA